MFPGDEVVDLRRRRSGSVLYSRCGFIGEQHARTRTGKTALPAMVLHLCRPGTLVVGRESAWALFRCGVLISFDHANGV